MYKQFIEEQLITRGIADIRILDAFEKVPREKFVPNYLKERAYEDGPLPIGFGATISQPYTVAFMTQLLKPREEDIVLEIGTGSGYQAAILSSLVKKVYSLEVIKELFDKAKENLREVGITNVEVINKNGYGGLSEFAPYDKIIVTAGAPKVPELLKDQLKDGGILVMPVGDGESQTMIKIIKEGGEFKEEKHGDFVFIPLKEG